jgi:hypothetical protein
MRVATCTISDRVGLRFRQVNGEARMPKSLKLHCRVRRMTSGIRGGGNESSKNACSAAANCPNNSPNMLKERIFIHKVRIPLRLKTRYHKGRAAGGKVCPSASVRAIAFEV